MWLYRHSPTHTAMAYDAIFRYGGHRMVFSSPSHANHTLLPKTFLRHLTTQAQTAPWVDRILFWGQSADRSVIQLAVAPVSDPPEEEWIRFYFDFTEGVPAPFKIDLVRLDRVYDETFKNRVLSEGRIVYANPERKRPPL